ncbi:hypothetical protein [Pseudovibrio sp. Tun.PSC04-5.I4]|uniref:hypothetical protein n=1 Tax=Pseudovibrio sp. Tun.PSC04-5.I4 TaxID=1798213 RepID=UPI000888F0D7|nr:hypothetical protein [Pseudovibrio sp. Tun.PSC04-5.I4]SDQ32717.1 hypothetical protein SAMN04515695_0859 [Pseudovibrio sp. Tun.PSC04-5.I4]
MKKHNQLSGEQKYQAFVDLMRADTTDQEVAERYFITVNQLQFLSKELKKVLREHLNVSSQKAVIAPKFSDLDCDVWEDFRKGELPEEEIDKQAKRQWKAALKSGRLSTDSSKANFADDWILIEVEDNGAGVFEHKDNGDHLPRSKKEAERYVVGPMSQ